MSGNSEQSIFQLWKIPFKFLTTGILGFSHRVPILVTVLPLQMAKSSVVWNPVIYVLMNKQVFSKDIFRSGGSLELPMSVMSGIVVKRKSLDVHCTIICNIKKFSRINWEYFGIFLHKLEAIYCKICRNVSEC